MRFLAFLVFSLTVLVPANALNVGGQLKNAQLENRTSDYGAGTRGRIWTRTDQARAKYDNGSSVKELLETDTAQVVTAKDIDGGTASNTSRLTLPKASTVTLNALTRKQATAAYDTTTGEVKVDDGSALHSLMPVGVVLPYGGSAAPGGWLLGDGTAVSRTTYAKLFTVVSGSFGTGDGSTTFNLPDCRRRTFVGAGGSGTATLANTVGATGGTESTTLTGTELPAHTHAVSITSGTESASHTHSGTTSSDGGQNTAYSNGGSGSGIEDTGDAGGFISTAPNHTHTITTGTASATHTHLVSGNTASTGTGSEFTNIQPSLVVNCIVKY